MNPVYVAYVSAGSSPLLLALILFRWKMLLKSKLLQMLGLLLLTAACADLASYVLNKMNKPNLMVVNSYYIIQFFIFSYIYYLVLPNKKLVYGGTALFTASFIINTFFFQPFDEFQNWSLLLGGAIVIVYAFMCLFHLAHLTIYPEGEFPGILMEWINIAVIYYFLMNFGLFYIYADTMDNKASALNYWNFHNINNIIKNVILGVGICFFKDWPIVPKPKPVPVGWEKEEEFS